MGLYRLLLALSVALGHLHYNHKVIIDGFIAVQCFFILSGFYIFKTLSENYNTVSSPVRTFYINRVLRILPMYWIAFLALMIWSVLQHFYFPHTQNRIAPFIFFTPKLNLYENLHFIFSNIFIIGLDWFHFIGFTPEHHYVFNQKIAEAQELIILKPSWSMALELIFYLLAPLLIKCKNRDLALIAIAMLCWRFYFYSKGFTGLNWIYMFFPFELSLFLLGALAYRISKKNYITNISIKSLLFFALPLSILIISIIDIDLYNCWVYYCLLLIILSFSSNSPHFFNSTDQLLGQLSYPIYIIHIVLVYIMHIVFKSENYVLFLILLTVAIIPMFFFQKKINSYRNKII